MKRKVVISLVLLAFLCGCATLGFKAWADRTPKEKAVVFLEQYNTQYRDTFKMATDPNITVAQKEIVKTKKAILKELWPLIDVYVGIVDSGSVPSKASEDKILDLINKLGGKI